MLKPPPRTEVLLENSCPVKPSLFDDRPSDFREDGRLFLFISVQITFNSEPFTMTKREIVRSVSEKLNLTQFQTKHIVQSVFDCIVETLVEEKRIELRNFGVFEVRKRVARKARNPRTGAEVMVPEKHVVVFKPGKALEEAIQGTEKKKKRK